MRIFFNNRLFRQLTLANFFSAMGRTLFDLVFILYATRFPNPELAVGIVTIITSLPYFFDFLVGYLADKTQDKYGRLTKTKGFQTGLYLLFALLTLGQATWWLFGLIVAINIVGDLVASYNHYLTLSLNQQIVGKDQLSDVLGFQNGLSNIIALSGKTLGTSLIILLNNNYFNFGLINAGFYFLSFALIFFLRQEFWKLRRGSLPAATKAGELPPVGNFIRETKDNMRILWQSPQISPFILLFIAMNLMSSSSYTLLMITLVADKHFLLVNLALTLTILESTEFLAGILGSFFPLTFYKRKSLASNVLVEMLTYLLYFINLVWIKNIYFLVVLTLILGYLGAISNPKTSAMIFNTVPEESQNAIFSIYSTLVTVTVPLASILMVGLLKLFSLQQLWLLLLIYASLVSLFSFGVWKWLAQKKRR